MKKFSIFNFKFSITFLLFIILNSLFFIPSASAVYDPLSVPNNKFGIHLIQATSDESSPAAELVNTNGDWGYVTILIESKDRNIDKWQEFFDDLRRRHLIPIVRIATKPNGNNWEIPYEGEEIAWADFLDNLNWPVKNRYIAIYNEPNHSTEWGGAVDPASYARVLDKTITALKAKNENFFVMNAGFDASAPSQPPKYEEQLTFMRKMNEEIPGIFAKLDGWVSHSYPNPNFSGSPASFGRGTVRTWIWELQVLRSFGVAKNYPIFITETGWKHAEGIEYDPFLKTAEKVDAYYKNAFENAWNSNRIAAVTPFLLSYQEKPFDHFSFKRPDLEKEPRERLASADSENGKIIPDYYPQYETLKSMPKTSAKPIQENKATLTKGEVFSTLVEGEIYDIAITLKNTGQSIWNDGNSVKLISNEDGKILGIEDAEIPKNTLVEPQKEYTFQLRLKTPSVGSYNISLNLQKDGIDFDSAPFYFQTIVKEAVSLKVKTRLKWKDSPQGEYILIIKGASGETVKKVAVNSTGESDKLEAKYLLPNYPFEFTLESENYHPKAVKLTLREGENTIDFGELQPKLLANLINPPTLWKLSPFSD